jgi:hypothetical protein
MPFEVETMHIVVVAVDVARVMATRHAACGWPLQVNVEWVCTWHEAVRRARELAAALVVVDCSRDLVAGQALSRHLLRHQPGLEVLKFADADGAGPRAHAGAWPWSALPLVLDEWLDLRLKLRGAATESGA